MHDKIQDVVDRASARRRLIRGAFAAPAALTLCSGSAFAASNEQCVRSAALAGETPGPETTSSADTWVRLQSRSSGTDAANGYWIIADDVSGLAPSGTFLTSDHALCVVSAGDYSAGVIYPAGSTAAPSNFAEPNGSYYAVLVDTEGKIVGISKIYGTSADGGAVGLSCWNSFSPRG
jgi:hypothetical protein